MLNNKSVLITGGTGSFGKFFTKTILKKYPKIKRLIIFSRDELKQFEFSQKFNHSENKRLRFFLGDIRDKDRLITAFRNVDVVIHAAALKQVPAGEYNPFEFIKTNVFGAQNILEACIVNRVKKIIALSTDKASSPVNLYGATKLCSDKVFIAAQNMFFKKNEIQISIVRYGNVFASRGSVIPFFLKQNSEKNFITVTDKKMTRFNLFLNDGVRTVLWTLKNATGGEIIIPKAPSIRIYDVASVINNRKIKIIGKRPGEKMHEELISSNESYNTIDLGDYYAVLPEYNYKTVLKNYSKKFKTSKFPIEKSYNSLTNKNYLSRKEIEKIINNYIKNNANLSL